MLVRATSDPGLRFDLEASSDLSAWKKVTASENGQATWAFDPASGEPQQFFRAVARP